MLKTKVVFLEYLIWRKNLPGDKKTPGDLVKTGFSKIQKLKKRYQNLKKEK